MAKRPLPADRITNPHASAEQWSVAAALEPLDKVADEIQRRWGIGVLERLVSPETAGKFASARYKLDEAIDRWDAATVAARAAVLMRGWVALEKEAREQGFNPGPAEAVWFVQSDDGTKFCFVPHERDVEHMSAAFPDHQVWSMREVCRILKSGVTDLASLHHARKEFPGATVTAVRTGRIVEDELPF